MITSAYAKDNGAYEQYQRNNPTVQHTLAVSEPALFDLSDGEFSTFEIGLCVVVIIVALFCVYKALVAKTPDK